jgi:hypothetical protein
MRSRRASLARRPAGAAIQTPPVPQGPQPLADRYTAGHAAAGVLMGLNGFSAPVAAAVLLAFQVMPELSRLLPGSFAHPRPDTVTNGAADFAAGMLGWWVIARLPTPDQT